MKGVGGLEGALCRALEVCIERTEGGGPQGIWALSEYVARLAQIKREHECVLMCIHRNAWMHIIGSHNTQAYTLNQAHRCFEWTRRISICAYTCVHARPHSHIGKHALQGASDANLPRHHKCLLLLYITHLRRHSKHIP